MNIVEFITNYPCLTISFVLQIIFIPIILSKAAAESDIINVLLGTIVAGLFGMIASIDVGTSILMICAAPLLMLALGSLIQIDDFYLKKTTKIRICMYFWVFAGVLIGYATVIFGIANNLHN